MFADELEEVLAESATDGRLLEDVRAWFARFLATVQESDLDLLALWAVHTHVAAETYTTPRLLIDSPVPGSGKTTCLEHLGRLCLAPVHMATLSSPAMLARILNGGIRTLLIDEADRSLDPKKEGIGDVLAVLNSGYKRGATRPVLVPTKGGGWDVDEMPTFAPVAMAGNTPNLPEDTRSRTIRVLLLPDTHGTVAESDWELIEPDAQALADRIRTWCDVNREQIRTARPQLPEGVVARFREKWQPLARVAEAAGGSWPAAVASMSVHDRDQVEADREDGMVNERPHVVLLGHLAAVWPDEKTFAPTSDLVDALVAGYPSAWSAESPYGKDLTTQRFGRMLATGYKVNSARESNYGPRGYRLSALLPVWSRMGIDPPQGTGSTGSIGSTGSPVPAHEAGSASSASSAGSSGRVWPDCGAPVPPGHGRCAGCYRARQAGLVR